MSPRGKTYMHIPGEGTRRQVGTRVAEITASRRRHFLSLAPALPYLSRLTTPRIRIRLLPLSARSILLLLLLLLLAVAQVLLSTRLKPLPLRSSCRVGQASGVEPTRGWRCTWNAVHHRRETTNLMCPPG